MVTALEVPADKLIERLAAYLKENYPEITPPPWAYTVKTSISRENPPSDPDWWYKRAASILRKLYKHGRPVGVERLRTVYGGPKDRGSAPTHFAKGSGSIIRKILIQLEKAGLVVKEGNKGRKLSPRGRSLLDRIAYEVSLEVLKENPEMAKYYKK